LNIQSSIASSSEGVIMMGTRWSLSSFSSAMVRVLHNQPNLHNFPLDRIQIIVNNLCKLPNVIGKATT
jgi:hypothetical protein